MNKKILGIMSLVVIGGLCFAPLLALAAASPPTVTLTPSPTEPPDLDPNLLLQEIIKYIFGFLIVVVVLMLMISAYMFVTAGGNPEQVTKAKNFLIYALIGLAVAVLARGLVGVVLTMLWGATTK
ncbi:MAG: pilin [Candidatus Parcubacteria bacterium]|nr:pilin [Candidatus Parcubacteria bacterium]